MSQIAGAATLLYRSPAPRALALCLLAVAVAIIAVMILHRLLILLHDPLIEEVRRSALLLKKVECAALAGLCCVLLHYIRGVRDNLAPLGVSDAAWPAATAAVLWLLPVINLLFAALLLREAWQASDPARAQSLFVNWRQSAASSLPFVWAALFLAALGLVIVPWADAGLAGSLLLSAVGEAVMVAAMLVLIVLVLRLALRQDRRAARRDVGALPAFGR
ncbi:DUF4328 domain-containing protein [Zavarzinia compransoris]|nr:DUF4328 domain-containing protein [Zavarzinia compransoris]TDP46163.1 uncharacterized protein DUF4328 [Zavarzinia compransoris]